MFAGPEPAQVIVRSRPRSQSDPVNYAGYDDPTINRSDPGFISRQEPESDIEALIQEQANGKFDVPGQQSIAEVDEFGFKTYTGDFSLSSEEILAASFEALAF
jgi:hypothetical protein